MILTFSGAAHEVTGSCYYLEACGKKFLVDYGMEQGKNLFENEPVPAEPAKIDFVLLTHAHIDHSGLLPLLYAKGFRGVVYATEGTKDLCGIMLLDSANIQEFEAEWRNRKGKREGKDEYVPLFTVEDAAAICGKIVSRPYGKTFSPAPGIEARFTDAGHLLGSASIELWLTEKNIKRKIVFSGDIGNLNQPLLKDPSYINEADYVVMESTYGDRKHNTPPDYVVSLAEVIQRTFDRGGNVVIPSFAIGRTQEMLYFIRELKRDKLIKGHDNFKVYVDSPLAIEACSIFNEHYADCCDEETKQIVQQGVNPLYFPGLVTAVTADESKAINDIEDPKVIISASGMCDAGRIKHHLKHNIWRGESTILFVGYQSAGTPGRQLVDGTDTLKLFGEEIVVRAEICQLPGVSGHADSDGLLKWAGAFCGKGTAGSAGRASKVPGAAGSAHTAPRMFFVTHGQDTVTDTFAERIHSELGCEAHAPYSGTSFDLASGEFIRIAPAKPIAKQPSSSSTKAGSVFERLQAAGARLLEVIRHNKGGANKDLAKFADQINALCDKWER